MYLPIRLTNFDAGKYLYPMAALIFKICHEAEWRDAEAAGVYRGSAKDKADGFLHFSTDEQLAVTLNRYYATADDLLLIAVDGDALGGTLKFETSSGGALYPHLYGELPLTAVRWVRSIPCGPNGEFLLPDPL
jgi:uncharacterized protein (DUF952 family)